MIIKEFKTYVVANPPPHHGGPYFVFVKLTTDNNIDGIGEAYGVPFSPPRVTQLIEDVCERHVVGWDPFNTERLWRVIYSSGYAQHPDLTTLGVLSAIEMACWDIVGKALNQPIYNLLGGQVREKLRSYTYLYPGSVGTETKFDNEDPIPGNIFGDAKKAPIRAAQYVEMGFTGVKFDPVMPMSAFDPRQLSLEALSNAELVVKNVREAVGDKCDLLIGTHGQMTTSSAIRLARRIERFDPLWFEEPVPPENRREMARVAHSTTIPVASGERLSTKYEFAELLQQQAAVILQMALGRVGGIMEAKKIAGMAEAHYAQIAPHLYCGPVEAAANIQIDTCSPNFLIQESIETFGGFYSDILEKPIQWQDGYIIPPTEPGLGVVLNEEVAAAHPFEGNVFSPNQDRPLD
ncbi:MAG: mandelate racemase/muconate lactonizing enzyme family protein [SAR202 cluster bacterium]|jgi:2-dehydro-3-deoxyphosphogalactonate aldolase|nr:mandelate racemase/muconate lactonizing enzyme family protein [SAR202 cluster bacterium]MDP6301447.1 mandelate racemase/muconate lactonizing enzyme family protein [SAR202 cluster bacterium]MDP7103827.1 mandelate racemase/muconate lactonizing enzyme family protein [SAR202 cluster bacterium]MDP7225341.1 mandelate racemase/muconate lactonizing enzyme family protein [SAR202 cluster bacterium]MDP7413524.1 mandelate racemase/muconate lactonizing enzyme family protein [SAR202 cluster bacterium]|tara:strand:- start:10849 stop:12066 length:1218 start_codon:yes stop_codon:yes gene_type:complete